MLLYTFDVILPTIQLSFLNKLTFFFCDCAIDKVHKVPISINVGRILGKI